jgi:hypothetical protein
MTKLRTPETFEEAIAQIAAGIGTKECAYLVERGDSTIRMWSNPDQDGRPTLHQAIKLDIAHAAKFNGRAPILEAYVARLREAGFSREVGDALTESLALPKAIGDLIEAVVRVTDAKSEGGRKISANEASSLLARLRAARRELDDVEAAVRKATK